MNGAIVAILVLTSVSQSLPASTRNPAGIAHEAVQPKPGRQGVVEKFRATETWKPVEDLIWALASQEKLSFPSTLVWASMIWNESRGQAGVIGDHGCAYGLGQLHLGGRSTKGKKCGNIRAMLPEELRHLPSSEFLKPEVNLAASLRVFIVRSGKSRPLDAAANYAGFASSKSEPAQDFLGKLRWWMDTGLTTRLQERGRTVAVEIKHAETQEDQADPMSSLRVH